MLKKVYIRLISVSPQFSPSVFTGELSQSSSQLCWPLFGLAPIVPRPLYVADIRTICSTPGGLWQEQSRGGEPHSACWPCSFWCSLGMDTGGLVLSFWHYLPWSTVLPVWKIHCRLNCHGWPQNPGKQPKRAVDVGRTAWCLCHAWQDPISITIHKRPLWENCTVCCKISQHLNVNLEEIVPK